MDVAGKAAHKLASRSSRRQFVKFMGAGSLGVGLWLTRTDVSLGAVSGCVGCGGGPCNPCFSPAPLCDNISGHFPCKTCSDGGGCPDSCQTSGEWFCCQPNGCRMRCSECNCPPGCGNPSCHCFTSLKVACAPTKSSATGCTC